MAEDISKLSSVLETLSRNIDKLDKRMSGKTPTRDYATSFRQSMNLSTPSFNMSSGGLSSQVGDVAKKFGSGLTSAFNKATLGAGPVLLKTLGNVLKDIFQLKFLKAFKDLFGGIIQSLDTALGRLTSMITGLLSYGYKEYLKMQRAVGSLAADIGLSREESRGLLLNMTELTTTAMKYGGSLEDVVSMMTTISDLSGKNRLVDKEDVDNITRLGIGTKLGVAGVTSMVTEFNNLGIAFNKTFSLIEKGRQSAVKLGLNTEKVLKSYQTLVSGLTGFQMKSGLDNMVKLATQATQLRMELSGVAETMSQAFFEPEGAVEAAAKMQVLGGQFAEKFGDAFDLMYKAQVSPEMFQKDLMEMVKGLAVKGENGLFYVPPQQMRMLQETAKVLGVQYKDLLNGAIEQGKLADKISALSSQGIMFKNDDDRQAIANLIDFDSESGSYMIRLMNGKKQLLKETSDRDISNILAEKKADDDAAKRRMAFSDRLSMVFNRFYMNFTQVFAEIFDRLDRSGFFEILETAMNKFSDMVVPAIKKLFDNKDGIGTYVQTFFTTLTNIVTEVIKILEDPEKTILGRIKDGAITLVSEVWKKVEPLIMYGFGGILRAMKDIPMVGSSLERTGMNMQRRAGKESSDVATIMGGEGAMKNLQQQIISKQSEGNWLANLGGGIGRLLQSVGNLVIGDWDYMKLRGRQSGANFMDIIGSNDDLAKMNENLASEGMTTGGGRAYQKEDVNDAIVTSNGRILKGAKGDIPALFDEAGLRNNMSNSGASEIKHSGVITVKSEDGKQITISDLDKIGRYTLAQYMDSINHGLKNGTAVYNNEKMPITPISA